MKKNRDLNIHEKAIRLIEGGVVEINGHFVRALINPYGDSCNECDMDSACDEDIVDLCSECEMITHKRYFLRFAYKRNGK